MKTSFLSLSDATHLAIFLFVLQLTNLNLGADSLWKEDSAPNSIFADKKAHRVGDIVTVIIQENNGATRNDNTTTAKSSSVNASISSMFYPPGVSGLLTKGGQLPAMNLGAKTAFNGGGSIANQETITAMLAVKVIDVLPNGNLVVEGRRQTAFGGEKQDAILRGTVRADDISATNSVYSFEIADASIQFLTKGSVSDSQRKGWFTKIWDKVAPF
ncbi:MAG TPA: flagellar basal body L-ring protein FlgH [Verrucomicrobiae bacterium]|jgi:flagellar L-ring protein precursor FlgH